MAKSTFEKASVFANISGSNGVRLDGITCAIRPEKGADAKKLSELAHGTKVGPFYMTISHVGDKSEATWDVQ